MERREFLKRAALAAGLGLKPAAAAGAAIVIDPGDAVASSAPARWAAEELRGALGGEIVPALGKAPAGGLTVVCAGPRSAALRGNLELPDAPEALAIARGKVGGRPVVLAAGSDVRGLVYALLELSERAGATEKPVVERPANRIRSIGRCFVSDVEDKPWYNDRAMWPEYLSMLAAQRFNRFSMTFGIGYDFLVNMTDVYFHFAYPFLMDVPGYKVLAAGLPDAERDGNLEMLKYIGEQTVARGLEFHVGLWDHGYAWTRSPKANYTIEGLDASNHGAYCRDAMTALLKAVPAISGVTLRVHGESGVAEGSYEFWTKVFEGVARAGRRVEINLHAKGIDERLIDAAVATGMPVVVAPKYWAEHTGLPYHQAAIRELEMPPRDRADSGFFALSSGSRSFMRYGYGDLLKEGRRYDVLHRMWPGTVRALLWGDPAIAAGFGRVSSFCGSAGCELFEPLSFKGRRGSGNPGGRCAYADASLNPRWDWEKFLYSYRVWGRLLYNPATDPDGWRRLLRKQHGAGAAAVEGALSNAGRILPLVTTAHGASGANNTYWPEMYTNMPIVDEGRRPLYGDSPKPRRFGFVSPFDPEMFARIDDFAGELVAGETGPKYSPVEVAQWIEDLAAAASRNLGQADARAASRTSPEFRRMATDAVIQIGDGRFFATKFRSAVLFAIFERTGNREALEQALRLYRQARETWAAMAERARGVYMADVSYGPERHLRGHWVDRLAAIDSDIADMEKRLEQAKPGADEGARRAIAAALGRPSRLEIPCRHAPPASFTPGRELALELVMERQGAAARLHYRHVNQAERWQVAEMKAGGGRHAAAIPASYTESPYPLQYYFELREGTRATLYPGLGPILVNQPYFVVRRGY